MQPHKVVETELLSLLNNLNSSILHHSIMQKVSSPSSDANYRLYRRRSPSRNESYLMLNVATINFIFLLLQCILLPNYAENIYEDDDTLRSSISQRQMNYQNSTDGSCHLSVSTKGVQETIGGRGLVFPIKSDDDNVDGLWVRFVFISTQPVI